MQAVFKDIQPELDNIKLVVDWWDVLVLYKLSNTSEYNCFIIKYRNFYYLQYADIF